MAFTNRKIINLDSTSIEQLSDSVYIARFHNRGGSYGSEWASSITMIVNGDECEMIAGISSGGDISTSSRLRELFRFLASIGIKHVVFSRLKNGRMIEHIVKI